MEVRMYFQILKRGWWIIALTVLVAFITALMISYFETPRYEAVARFIVTPGIDLTSDRYQVLSSLNTLDNQVITETYAEVMNSERIYSEAIAFLQIQETDLAGYEYEAEVISSTSVLELTVTGTDPEMVAKLASAVGSRTINFIRQLNQGYNFDFLDIPVPPSEPYSPNPLLNGGMAIVLGLVGGILFAVLSEQLRAPIELFRQRLQFDAITGVYTKKYFSRILDNQLSLNPDNVFTIGIVEISGIRDIIDALPILSFQRVLQKVTEILRRELRGNDVIARWNDYSFIILLPNTHASAAKSIFDRISQMLSQPVDFDDLVATTIEFDPVIGGAEYSNNITSQELYEKTENALEQARRSNEGSIYVWEIKNPFWSQLAIDENDG